MTNNRRRFAAGAFVAAALVQPAVVVVAMAPQAAQASGTGATCPTSRFCLYYSPAQQGGRADLYVSDYALNNENFDDGPSGVAGFGQVVGNNSASYWNRRGQDVAVYDGQNCSGTSTVIPSGAKGTFVGLRNKVSSMVVFSGDSASCIGLTNVDQSKY